MASTNPTKRRRRWLRFSLRTLLVVMTIIAVVCGTVMKRARDQRVAVAAVLKSGGHIIYDFELDEFELVRRNQESLLAAIAGKPAPTYFDEPWEPRWLLDAIGIDCFHRVKQVSLYGPRATDSTIEHVTHLSGVKILQLYNTSVTDAGLPNFHRLREVKHLTIERCHISDAGMPHIGRLRNLEFLRLEELGISDEGLEHLTGLRKLVGMEFSHTRVTKDTAEKLRRTLPNCRHIVVYP